MEDCRAMVTGGIITGLEIWEMAVTPYILNNSETWNSLPKTALDLLEDLQFQFLRNILATPRTCPTPSLLWETGTMSMENKIIKKKLLFFHHLHHLSEDSLAWQICQTQSKLALPGLVQECESLIDSLELPSVGECSQLKWKNEVNKKLLTKNRNDLLEQMEKKNYRKIDVDELRQENFEMKKYMCQLTMHSARTKFALRTKMTKKVKILSISCGALPMGTSGMRKTWMMTRT